MYGSVIEAGEKKFDVFNYGIPIPREIIHNDQLMNIIRKSYMYNSDIPGNIEDIHPNKFLASIYVIKIYDRLRSFDIQI